VSEPAPTRTQPTATEILDRYLPFIAVGAMVMTFLVMPQPFAVTVIGAVWLVATRLTKNRKFLGLTLTEALAWAATIVIALLVIAFALYSLGAPAA
jgi:hypothetical protein